MSLALSRTRIRSVSERACAAITARRRADKNETSRRTSGDNEASHEALLRYKATNHAMRTARPALLTARIAALSRRMTTHHFDVSRPPRGPACGVNRLSQLSWEPNDPGRLAANICMLLQLSLIHI